MGNFKGRNLVSFLHVSGVQLHSVVHGHVCVLCISNYVDESFEYVCEFIRAIIATEEDFSYE